MYVCFFFPLVLFYDFRGLRPPANLMVCPRHPEKSARDPKGTWKSNHRSWWMHRPRTPPIQYLGLDHHLGYLKVKIDGLPIPKGGLVKGPYKPICRDG